MPLETSDGFDFLPPLNKPTRLNIFDSTNFPQLKNWSPVFGLSIAVCHGDLPAIDEEISLSRRYILTLNPAIAETFFPQTHEAYRVYGDLFGTPNQRLSLQSGSFIGPLEPDFGLERTDYQRNYHWPFAKNNILRLTTPETTIVIDLTTNTGNQLTNEFEQNLTLLPFIKEVAAGAKLLRDRLIHPGKTTPTILSPIYKNDLHKTGSSSEPEPKKLWLTHSFGRNNYGIDTAINIALCHTDQRIEEPHFITLGNGAQIVVPLPTLEYPKPTISLHHRGYRPEVLRSFDAGGINPDSTGPLYLHRKTIEPGTFLLINLMPRSGKYEKSIFPGG